MGSGIVCTFAAINYFMAKKIPVIKFHKDKYGDELLIDVVTLDMIRNSKTFADVMRQSFFGLMLTTGGEGDVEVDGVPCEARKGLMACPRPGDVCTVLRDDGLTSLELISSATLCWSSSTMPTSSTISLIFRQDESPHTYNWMTSYIIRL